MIESHASRRAFLGVLFSTAGGAAASMLTACGAAAGPSEGQAVGISYQRGVVEPAEVVPLRAGVAYSNILPTAVPWVRTQPGAGSIYPGGRAPTSTLH